MNTYRKYDFKNFTVTSHKNGEKFNIHSVIKTSNGSVFHYRAWAKAWVLKSGEGHPCTYANPKQIFMQLDEYLSAKKIKSLTEELKDAKIELNIADAEGNKWEVFTAIDKIEKLERELENEQII